MNTATIKSRHTLDARAVAFIKRHLTRKVKGGYGLQHSRYLKEFQAMGGTIQQAARAWEDCYDIAELELNATA